MIQSKLFWNKVKNVGLLICLCFIIQSCSSSGDRQRKSNNVVSTDEGNGGKKAINSINICTWNLENFGYSKNNNIIRFVAKTISKFDIIAIQEVDGKSGGADAVIRLVHQLNNICRNCQWGFAISLRTTGSAYQSERYAYLWKKSKVTHISLGWLDKKYSTQIEREPFLATFEAMGKKITLVNFHAIPKSRQPEREIKYLKYFPVEYPNKHLIFLGDFNTPYTNSVFTPLKKQGYKPALIDQKTTLRQKCINGDCLASEYDNIFYPTEHIEPISSGILHFYKKFNGNMNKARMISDHVPVFFKFKIK